MYMPHPRGKPSKDEAGCFMFFVWPILLVAGIIQIFFAILGWLFEQWWFYVLLSVGMIFLTVRMFININ